MESSIVDSMKKKQRNFVSAQRMRSFSPGECLGKIKTVAINLVYPRFSIDAKYAGVMS